MTERRAWERDEPTVEELLSDPILGCLARRDGLTLQDVRQAVDVARRNLKRDSEVAGAAA